MLNIQNLWVRVLFNFYAAVQRVLLACSTPIKWTVLKSLCGSRLAQSTMFLPFLGYLVIYNEQISQYFSLESTIPECGIGFGYQYLENRVDFLFLGGVFFGMGVFLYQLACPKVIKENGAAENFSEKRVSADNSFDLMQSLLLVRDRYASSRKIYSWLLSSVVGARNLRNFRLAMNANDSRSFDLQRPTSYRFDIGMQNRLYNWFNLILHVEGLSGKVDRSRFLKNLKISCSNTLARRKFSEYRSSQELVINSLKICVGVSVVPEIIGYNNNLGRDIYHLHFACENRARLLARVVVLLFLVASFFLLLAPTALTAMYAMDKICIFS